MNLSTVRLSGSTGCRLRVRLAKLWYNILTEETMYERFHICDINIEDEQKSNNGRDISVYVDTLGMVNIEIGESLTIRTDLNGLADLREILSQADEKLDQIHYNKVCDKMDELTEEINQPIFWGAGGRAKSTNVPKSQTPTQTHDVWMAVDAEINDEIDNG